MVRPRAPALRRVRMDRSYLLAFLGLPRACVRDLINSVCVRGLRVRPRATGAIVCERIADLTLRKTSYDMKYYATCE